MRRFDRTRICCCRLARPRGRTCSSARCSPSNCSGPPRSSRTIPITARASVKSGALALALVPLLAASAPAQPQGQPLDDQLKQARAEQVAAEAETAKLEQTAARAKGEAERLHAQEAAAAQAIE